MAVDAITALASREAPVSKLSRMEGETDVPAHRAKHTTACRSGRMEDARCAPQPQVGTRSIPARARDGVLCGLPVAQPVAHVAMALRVLSGRDRGALAWPVPLVRTAARALFLRPRPTRCDFSHPALL